MNVPLSKLNYSFNKKPLLIGGLAMEYYGLRKAGKDIDLIVIKNDLVNLIKQYPDRLKNLGGDLGVCPFEFEIWKTICYFGYDELIEGAIDKENYLIISLEKLLFLKSLGMKKDKYLQDLYKITSKILNKQSEKYNEIKLENDVLLKNIENIAYIQKNTP